MIFKRPDAQHAAITRREFLFSVFKLEKLTDLNFKWSRQLNRLSSLQIPTTNSPLFGYYFQTLSFNKIHTAKETKSSSKFQRPRKLKSRKNPPGNFIEPFLFLQTDKFCR